MDSCVSGTSIARCCVCLFHISCPCLVCATCVSCTVPVLYDACRATSSPSKRGALTEHMKHTCRHGGKSPIVTAHVTFAPPTFHTPYVATILLHVPFKTHDPLVRSHIHRRIFGWPVGHVMRSLVEAEARVESPLAAMPHQGTGTRFVFAVVVHQQSRRRGSHHCPQAVSICQYIL